ncbi:hypothetical protein TALK_13440 [Thalassospira alkalitolerans]|uniref:Uncharacterized protein n=1 Tax=Thalassospira alkalitolerans TaxID=1293890 RepID=A0A1Y2LAT4_9PROT|nr:hypothetical protein TALK_13440 [Thalassospira alkalitolerans]
MPNGSILAGLQAKNAPIGDIWRLIRRVSQNFGAGLAGNVGSVIQRIVDKFAVVSGIMGVGFKGCYRRYII